MIDPAGIVSSAAPSQNQSQTQGQGSSGADALLDKEAAWKQSFRDTLAEIRDGGFSAYAEKVREEKLAELREKILQEMGLSEKQLQAMPVEQRQQIEKMVEREIQARLAAERDAEDAKGKKGTLAHVGAMANQQLSTANGLANGATLIAVMDQVDASASADGQDLPGNGHDRPAGAAKTTLGPGPDTNADGTADDTSNPAKAVDPDRRKG